MTAQLPLPPGSFGLPFIGETLSFLRDPSFATKRQAQYGSIFKSKIINQPTVFLCGPEANEFLLSSHMDCFSWRGGWPGTFKELLGESLFLQEGEEHRRNRKLLMPAFHGKALESYFATMVDLSQTYLNRWEQKRDLVWFTELKQFTFEVASVLLMGTEKSRGDDTGRHSYQASKEIEQLSGWFTDLTNGLFTLPVRWGPTPYRKALQGRDRLLAYIDQEIGDRRRLLASQQSAEGQTVELRTKDVLTLLLETEDEGGDRLSEQEIKVQTLLMLFAGHETTTSMLTSLVMALAQHPEVLAKARSEQAQLTQATNALTLQQIQQMPYLDQILKEVERKYPPIGGGFRKVIKPFEFNGYHVPAGWLALYRIDAAHRDERCYTHPDSFDPDRFSPERAEQKRYDYSLVGFGGGPRVCLGMAFAKLEMKVIAAQLLRGYQWKIKAEQDLTLNPVPSLRPRDGLRVTFEPRNG